MTEAQSIITSFIGYNMHNLNATHLDAIATKVETAGFHDDLNMKKGTGYASLFSILIPVQCNLIWSLI